MTGSMQAVQQNTPERTRGVLLELTNVCIRYEAGAERVVAQDVDLQLFEGETILFLGPSGCGKSTLAMLCANLIPEIVEADVRGQVARDPGLSRPGAVGYVFQDPDAQFCMLHADDEIAFGLENCSLPRTKMEERIAEAVQTVGLSHVIHTRHETFSGGMKQKLAIASALAMGSRLLVLDEPTANLDPLSTGQVFRMIGELRKASQTMIVIEHKFDALLAHTDRVLLMNRDGRIHRIGPTQTVVSEEWDWMVAEGVVAPWKSRPGVVPKVTESRPGGEILRKPVVSEPAVEIERGQMQYGSKQVWNDVNVTVHQGSFVAVVGPNGTGKSSLLQAMAGLQKLGQGTCRLFGKPISAWKTPERMRAVSYCFQNPEYQFIYERVGDELANRVVEGDIPAAIWTLLNEFELSECIHQSPFGLSQGQKRRLSVASMLRENHEIYFLDEPTYGQDARTQEVILQRLEQLHAAGKTIVLTTHDMDLVKRYATQVVVLGNGQVLFSGAPEVLFDRSDVLVRAHLLDDIQADYDAAPSLDPSLAKAERPRRRAPIAWLNPPVHLTACLIAIIIAIFAHNLAEALAVFLLPIALMLVVGWMTPWQVMKRLAPFVGFYILYVWSLTAYARVDAGTPTFDFLWIHASWPGFLSGLVLAFRMTGAVCFGILFVSGTDITDLIVGLCKNFRASPQLSYGMLAGIRFVPLFQSEWGKLKQARQLRGKDAKWSFARPIVYALPLLTQAIRMSERVAVAMEARGFVGDVAHHVAARTFYRQVRIRWWDLAYAAFIIAATWWMLIVF